MNKNKDSINVYWSENHDIDGSNWSFLYQKPTSLFSELNKIKEKDNSANFLTCPSISNKSLAQCTINIKERSTSDNFKPVGRRSKSSINNADRLKATLYFLH